MRDFAAALNRWLLPLKSRIMLMVGKCILKAVADDKAFQQVQLTGFENEVLEGVERFQDYGMTSHPPDKSEAVVVCLGGNREQAVVIRMDNREFRLKNLAKGEVALYTDEGDKIHFKRGNIIEATTSKYRVNLSTLKVQNASNELVSVLIQLLEEIISARTLTALGPQPLIGLNQTFPVIKAKLETFKE